MVFQHQYITESELVFGVRTGKKNRTFGRKTEILISSPIILKRLAFSFYLKIQPSKDISRLSKWPLTYG